MREIKFRAWDNKQKLMSMPMNISDMVSSCVETWFSSGLCYYKNLEWLQFTGLKDKNGKEIYEGDICKYGIGNWVGKIVYIKGAYLLDERKWLHEYQGER